MSIRLDEQFKRLVPAALYYPYKIAKESRRGEPELAILRQLVPTRGTAIDVGANRGIYSYALSRIVDRVEAFEPNPHLAALLRRKLAPRVSVHEVALGRAPGCGRLVVPRDERGFDEPLRGRIAIDQDSDAASAATRIAVRRLDDLAFADVVFIKIDTEGADTAVIAGAAGTIAAWRPILLVELLAGTYDDPRAEIAAITRRFGYDSWLVDRGRRIPAWEALDGRAGRVMTSNVLFTPQ